MQNKALWKVSVITDKFQSVIMVGADDYNEAKDSARNHSKWLIKHHQPIVISGFQAELDKSHATYGEFLKYQNSFQYD